MYVHIPQVLVRLRMASKLCSRRPLQLLYGAQTKQLPPKHPLWIFIELKTTGSSIFIYHNITEIRVAIYDQKELNFLEHIFSREQDGKDIACCTLHTQYYLSIQKTSKRSLPISTLGCLPTSKDFHKEIGYTTHQVGNVLAHNLLIFVIT